MGTLWFTNDKPKTKNRFLISPTSKVFATISHTQIQMLRSFAYHFKAKPGREMVVSVLFCFGLAGPNWSSLKMAHANNKTHKISDPQKLTFFPRRHTDNHNQNWHANDILQLSIETHHTRRTSCQARQARTSGPNHTSARLAAGNIFFTCPRVQSCSPTKYAAVRAPSGRAVQRSECQSATPEPSRTISIMSSADGHVQLPKRERYSPFYDFIHSERIVCWRFFSFWGFCTLHWHFVIFRKVSYFYLARLFLLLSVNWSYFLHQTHSAAMCCCACGTLVSLWTIAMLPW